MTGKIFLSVGMPRAGSGWYYNLTNDLLVAAGHANAREIRRRFHLQGILTEVNMNIAALTPRRLLLVSIPALLGNTFAVKAHARPTPLAHLLVRRGLIRPTYIYRDPRDALLSAYEYGQRARRDGRDNALARLNTIDKAVEFMQEYICISEAWLAFDRALHVRYEDLLQNYERESLRLLDFLNLDSGVTALRAVVDQYRPEQGRTDQNGLHLATGKIGRFREAFTDQQKERFLQVFGAYLEKLDYSL